MRARAEMTTSGIGMRALSARSASKFANIAIRKGDTVRIVQAGGGGYGDPHEREPEALLFDVTEGNVSVEVAREDYGVIVEGSDPTTYRLSIIRTQKLRETGALGEIR